MLKTLFTTGEADFVNENFNSVCDGLKTLKYFLIMIHVVVKNYHKIVFFQLFPLLRLTQASISPPWPHL